MENTKTSDNDEPKIGGMLEVGRIFTGPIAEILPNGSVLIETSNHGGCSTLVCAKPTGELRLDGSGQRQYWTVCDYSSERHKSAVTATPPKPPTPKIGDRIDIKISGHIEGTISRIDWRQGSESRFVAGERVLVPLVDVFGDADVEFDKCVSISWNYGASDGQGYWEAEFETA